MFSFSSDCFRICFANISCFSACFSFTNSVPASSTHFSIHIAIHQRMSIVLITHQGFECCLNVVFFPNPPHLVFSYCFFSFLLCLQSKGVWNKSFRHSLLSKLRRRSLWTLSYIWVGLLTFQKFNQLHCRCSSLCMYVICVTVPHHPHPGMLTSAHVFLFCTSAALKTTCSCFLSSSILLSGWKISLWTWQQLLMKDTSSWRSWRLSGVLGALHKEMTWNCSVNRM